MKQVVNAIIKQRDKFLIIKRKQGIHAKKWAFPGGIVEPNETLTQALKREIKEETNLDIIKIIKQVSEYEYKRENNEKTKGTSYLVSVKGNIKTDKKEIEEYKWTTLEQMQKIELAPGIEEECLMTM